MAVAGFGLIGLISRSGGLATVANQIRTSSPVHPASCGACHNGGPGSGAMAIVITDMMNNVVTGYSPNQTYLVNVGIQQPVATVGGFQIECLDGLNNKIGTFAAGAGSQVSTIGAYEVVEHNGPGTFINLPIIGNSATWTFSWTAPATAGLVPTFYSNGVAANGNGGTSGDNGYASSLSFASLPVIFESFESMLYDNRVKLMWSVEELEGASTYLVERAAGQEGFRLIGEKAAKGETGYQFTDHEAPLGVPLRYRIIQVDIDGSRQSSKVLSTFVSPAQNGIVKMYPNPLQAGHALSLTLWSENEGSASLRWLSMDGKGQQLINQHLIKGENQIQVPSPRQAGSYILELQSRGKRETRIVQVH